MNCVRTETQYNAAHTFTSQGGDAASVTVVTKATVGQDVGAPLTNCSLTFNGTPGFPLQPIPGTRFEFPEKHSLNKE